MDDTSVDDTVNDMSEVVVVEVDDASVDEKVEDVSEVEDIAVPGPE